MSDSTQKQPYVFVPSLAKHISNIRTSLRYQAELLRDFDGNQEAELVARRLDRLRMDLKQLAGE